MSRPSGSPYHSARKIRPPCAGPFAGPRRRTEEEGGDSYAARNRNYYMDHATTTPSPTQRWSSACCRFSASTSATRAACTDSDARRWRRWTRRASTVAAILSCRPTEIVFTGGGTEADNLAIKGVGMAAARQARQPYRDDARSSTTPCCTASSSWRREGFSDLSARRWRRACQPAERSGAPRRRPRSSR